MNEIFTRRSVRSFLDKKVEDEKITELLKAGMQAPSAANQQCWEFIVVENREMLRSLSKYSPYSSCLAKSPLAIILLGNKNVMKFPENWEQDLGACTQNILLQGVNLGLGSVWLATFGDKTREKYIADLFNLDDNLIPYSVIALGYPKDENANRFIDRYDESKIHYEKY